MTSIRDYLSKSPVGLIVLAGVCLTLALISCRGTTGFVNIWGAVEADDPVLIEKYAKAGGDLNIVGFNGWTPLYQALYDHKGRAYEKLLELGADPNFVMEGGRVVTNMAANERGMFWLEKALEHGGDPNLLVPNTTSRFKGRPLLYAMQGMYYTFAMVRLLVEHGADINLTESDGRNYLDIALARAKLDAVLYFLDQGAEYNLRWTL